MPMICRKCSEKLDGSMAINSVRSHYRQFSAHELPNRRLFPGNPLRRMKGFIDWAVFQEICHVRSQSFNQCITQAAQIPIKIPITISGLRKSLD